MRFTDRQRSLLNKLDQVIYRKKSSGVPGYFIGREECTTTIRSLIAKGLIEPGPDNKSLRSTGVMPRA